MKDVYLSGLEWTKTHDDMGGVMGNLVFKDNVAYEDYEKLLKSGYFVLCDKDYITNLQQENFNLRENILIHKMSFKSDDKSLEHLINMPSYEELQQENERLKEENNNKATNDYAHAIDESWYRELYDDYKSRCEKILEIIQKRADRFIDGSSRYNLSDLSISKIENILQNGSDEK